MRPSSVAVGLLVAVLWLPLEGTTEPLDIREWEVPWRDSQPRDPFVEPSGTEWDLPSGKDSRPYGMAVDTNDRMWIVETGAQPNRFVGFDTVNEAFLDGTDVPSGGGTIRHMYYYEPAGEVWFGTDTNYVGRAKVH